MPDAEILTIGTELLLGEIADTNTQKIARALLDSGVNLYRTMTVGDNAGRIAEAVKESLHRAEIVITTGGLGPTVDDATREGIARALGVELIFEPELWAQIQNRFEHYGRMPEPVNRRQAYIPAGAIPIPNPVGTAPAFAAPAGKGLVVALPGVPAEMDFLLHDAVMPLLREYFHLESVLITRLLRTAGVGESAMEGQLEDLERMINPTLGLSAHPGRVDLRLTARASTSDEARQMLDALEAEVRGRLGDAIYGQDGQTLEGIVLELLAQRGWRLATIEAGTHGLLAAGLSAEEGPYIGGRLLPTGLESVRLREMMQDERATTGAEAILGLTLRQEPGRSQFEAQLIDPLGEHSWGGSYGGAPANAARWAASLALNGMRRRLIS